MGERLLNWTVEEVPQLRGYQIEWAGPEDFYLSRSNSLFHTKSLSRPFNKIAVIDAPFWKTAVSHFRPAQRLLRFLVTNVIPLTNGDIFVTFDKSAGIVRNGKYLELKGLIRPCRVLRSACAVDSSGNVFFGEYLANDERGEMRVYKYVPGKDIVTVVYSFPPNSIKHIHGIYFDPFTGSIFCLTGDDESECRIIRSHDEFKTFDIVGEGDETWRAVSLLFDDKSIFFGMDAEFRSNHIYRLDRVTNERTSLGEVSGTVFYSKQIGADLFFATTAENAPSQTENVAALWNADADGNLTEVTRFKKDRWHPTLFMFGTIHFPYANHFEDTLYFSLVGVEQDNRTFRITAK